MFEAFVGSFLGVWAVFAILFVKDAIGERREAARREREEMKRLREQMARDTRSSVL